MNVYLKGLINRWNEWILFGYWNRDHNYENQLYIEIDILRKQLDAFRTQNSIYKSAIYEWGRLSKELIDYKSRIHENEVFIAKIYQNYRFKRKLEKILFPGGRK